ncbi:bactofilin family protein [Candidatus Thiothrix anitrata]|jgi:cytoskeletal protein CcmA (bactofilin family)|uniref:Polymer-forming cytoskeletal protein n=1 Tax=Candidatus Thiothrix anitrata TaxID=2823902 RepID=A0ABX7X2B7_9GAMM|nr:polymer-forming cytoskeletal protein [Candidatus Thiothrix anitrata]QTR50066.1 polymer-forming cytoskeletal protein [Candidatus Thiothrix anitrata]
MFGKSAKTGNSSNSSSSNGVQGDQKIRRAQVDTLIGRGTTIDGDLRFSGGLHIEGVIKGNLAADGDDATLILSEHGHIQGEVRVPSMVLNGMIDGDVFASGKVELFEKARICGDVYYNLLEMAVGAEVNGKLVRQKPDTASFAPKASATE